MRMMSASGIHHFWLNTEQTVRLCLYENPSTRCPTLRRTIYSRRPQRGASPFNEAARFSKKFSMKVFAVASIRTDEQHQRKNETKETWMDARSALYLRLTAHQLALSLSLFLQCSKKIFTQRFCFEPIKTKVEIHGVVWKFF